MEEHPCLQLDAHDPDEERVYVAPGERMAPGQVCGAGLAMAGRGLWRVARVAVGAAASVAVAAVTRSSRRGAAREEGGPETAGGGESEEPPPPGQQQKPEPTQIERYEAQHHRALTEAGRARALAARHGPRSHKRALYLRRARNWEARAEECLAAIVGLERADLHVERARSTVDVAQALSDAGHRVGQLSRGTDRLLDEAAAAQETFDEARVRSRELARMAGAESLDEDVHGDLVAEAWGMAEETPLELEDAPTEAGAGWRALPPVPTATEGARARERDPAINGALTG